MSQNIKLNMLVGADQSGITELSKIYRAYRTMWRGYKAIATKFKEDIDVDFLVFPSIHAEYDMVMGRIAYYKNKMMEIRAQIYNKIHVFVERYTTAGYAQPATATPAVDQNLVNTLRTLFDANPQLKAQVQALLAIVALQSVQQHQ